MLVFRKLDLYFLEKKKKTLSVIFASSKKMIGWILQTFKTRDAKLGMTFFKALTLSSLEYYCVLTSPFKADESVELENVQRSFTARIDSVQNQ